MTKMLSASGDFAPWPGALPPDPYYRLVLRTRHGAPQPLTPSAAYEFNWTLPRYLKPKVGAYEFKVD